MAISLTVNGMTRSVEAEPGTPLLYVLRNDFELNSAKLQLLTYPLDLAAMRAGAGPARASRMAASALLLARRPVVTIEQRSA